MVKSVSQPLIQMEFAPSPQNTAFVAAIQFRRTRSELVKAPGYENYGLQDLPSVTWWWYEVEMKPVVLLAGSWDLEQQVALRCRGYLAKSPDVVWVGIIVRDEKGSNKWLKDYAIRQGAIIEPDTQQTLGPESELGRIVGDYRTKHGL